MARKGNPHSDASKTDGEKKEPRVGEVAARGFTGHKQRKLRPLRRAHMLLRKKLLS